MTMSRDERRELAQINQFLSDESELAELAALFAEPPVLSHAGAVPVTSDRDRPRHLSGSVVVALVAVVLAVVGGSVIASVGDPTAIAVAAVLVVSSGLALAAALIRYARPG